MVTRGPGGTPLPLPPPRRLQPAADADALGAADILQLPIVFADDPPPRADPAPLQRAAEGAVASRNRPDPTRVGPRRKLTSPVRLAFHRHPYPS